MRGAVLVLLVGCGRIGFDDVALVAGDGGPADAPCTFGPFGPPDLISTLGSSGIEWGPWISEDRTEVLFSSDRGGSLDLYRATRASPQVGFDTPKRIDILSDAVAIEDDPVVTKDGHFVLFNSTVNSGLEDIFIAPKGGATFGTPKPLANVNQDTFRDDCPALTDGDRTLIFASTRSGGNQRDLFIATRPDLASEFGLPNRIEELASPEEDGCPTVTPDGSLIFHRSATTVSVLVISRRGNAGYLPPTRITELSDGTTNDVDPYLTRDGLTLIFGSDRSGDMELYVSERTCQ